MNVMESNNPNFKHGVNEKEAAEYLKSIGVYEDVISKAVFGGTGFEIIIAANVEYNSRNGTTQQ